MKLQFQIGNRFLTLAIRRPDNFFHFQRTTHAYPDVFTRCHCLWVNVGWLTLMTFKYVVEQDAVNNHLTRLDEIARDVKFYSHQTNKEIAS